MFTFNPIWAISEYGAKLIESGMADFVARIDAARIRTDKPPMMQMAGDVAIIDVQGVMQKRESLWTAFGLATSTEATALAIDTAREDVKVKSIILRIDSPGGTVDGQYRVVSATQKAAAEKPLYAQIDGQAASAGYWLASQARKVFAGPGDEVGSIGVRLMLYDFSKMFDREGIEAVPIDSGEFKSAGAMGTEITERQREYFQGMVDAYYTDFMGDVKTGRHMTNAKAAEVGDGRMFHARQAAELGLIDGIQVLEDTIRVARRATGRATGTAKARARVREMIKA